MLWLSFFKTKVMKKKSLYVIAILFLLACLFGFVLFLTSCKSHRFKTRTKASKTDVSAIQIVNKLQILYPEFVEE
jgi:Na+/proline symporter